jgi:hypothetical protein
MKVTIGRIVIYKTTDQDKDLMRAAGLVNGGCNVPDELPAVVVNVWGESCINLRVICDGKLDMWKTSITEGTTPGTWHWPVKEE